MDKIERRVVAHELALIEVAAHIEREHLEEAKQAIRAGFVIGISDQERGIRTDAIELLDDALHRFEHGMVGMFLYARGVP